MYIYIHIFGNIRWCDLPNLVKSIFFYADRRILIKINFFFAPGLPPGSTFSKCGRFFWFFLFVEPSRLGRLSLIDFVFCGFRLGGVCGASVLFSLGAFSTSVFSLASAAFLGFGAEVRKFSLCQLNIMDSG